MKKIISCNDKDFEIMKAVDIAKKQDETNQRMFSVLDKYKDDFKEELGRFDKMWNKDWE